MIKNIIEKKMCTGCGVCSNVCPNKCIEMISDPIEGFLYPVINYADCINCNNCKEICPIINKTKKYRTLEEPKVYAAWSKNDEIRYNSTSGGIFSELAISILNEGGSIAAARYNDKFQVEHCLISSKEDLPVVRQSKYAQSDTKDIFLQVVNVLKKNKKVLFCGTPCQCAALQMLTKNKYDNLLLCDFICKGVNSPKAYEMYLQELEQKYNSEIQNVWFKNKKNGWNNFGTKITFKNGCEYFEDRENDLFMYGYIKKDLNLYIRSSCNKCEFKGINRDVDITLADFWGIEIRDKKQNINDGVSAVIIHTEKGEMIFDKIKNTLFIEEHTINEVIKGNRCMLESSPINKKKYTFWRSNKHNFSERIKEIIEDIR